MQSGKLTDEESHSTALSLLEPKVDWSVPSQEAESTDDRHVAA